MLIGRNEEYTELLSLLDSDKSEFVAVYGRRRVGKTFLIREAFQYHFAFQHTGIYQASMGEQLSEFQASLYAAGMKKCAKPKTWYEAFHLLESLLAQSADEKKVVFIDELPWMDTPRANFIRALDHFWNGWASARKDIILIICGSATSWIINKVIMNYGGLHNRLTKQIFLEPFTLNECEQYCKEAKLGYTRKQILEAYMILGGIPFYWSFLQKGKSLAQNIDRMFFSPRGEMRQEFDALYASLFRHPVAHIAIISTLTSRKKGLSRSQIIEQSGLCDNMTLTNAIKELEQCGFIRKYYILGQKSKGAIYQLMDNYTLFYYQFIQENRTQDQHFWSSSLNTPTHNTWAGLAFERVCLQHVGQIKAALGFSAVLSNEYSWGYRSVNEKGAQIDLLIDRNDQVINLCEMKYSIGEYSITPEEDLRLKNRVSTFIRESNTKKAVFLTMVTTFGLSSSAYSDDIPCQVKMDDLFLP